ncbi:MAG: hypothetical protein N3G22_03005 [Candidatus Micrarchaeota archaeon]|nr:hypothetical protein [Candidatus Micrarchaeota archaeon]
MEWESPKGDAAAKVRIATLAVAEVLLICASVLVFFVLFDLPPTLSAGGALLSFFSLSIFSIISLGFARVVLLGSLAAMQIALLLHFPFLLLPFVLIDAVALIAVIFSMQYDDAPAAQGQK